MTIADECAAARTKTIVVMAVSFTSMLRVFKKDSAKVIKEMIEQFLPRLRAIHNQHQFEVLHDEFCQRFVATVCLAKARDGRCPHASYGHAAKVLDVALKVCVDYCQLPDAATSQRVRTFLHAGIDTPLLKKLKKKERLTIMAFSVQDIDRETYQLLQAAVARQIKAEFGGTISAVTYDNIMWRRLNRADDA